MKFQADIEGSTKRLCWWIGCGVCEKEIFGLNKWRGGEATELGSVGEQVSEGSLGSQIHPFSV